MDIEQVLAGLAERLGLPRMHLDEDRACAFRVDDDVHAELRYDERADVLCLYATVAGARPTELPRVVSTLLEANDRPEAMQGAHFTVGPDLEEIVLCRTLDVDGGPTDELVQELTGMVAASREWRARFEQACIVQ